MLTVAQASVLTVHRGYLVQKRRQHTQSKYEECKKR